LVTRGFPQAWLPRAKADVPRAGDPVHKMPLSVASTRQKLRFPKDRADNDRDGTQREMPVPTNDPIPAVRDRLADQVSAQNLRLIDAIAALIRDNVGRGTLKSNEPLMQGTILCCEAIQNRLDIFLATLKEGFKGSALAKNDIGPAELKELVAEFFRPNDPFIKDQLSNIITTTGAPDVLATLQSKVESTRAHVLTRLSVEIDILCHRVQRKQARFWHSTSFATSVLVAEIACSLATVWFAYNWTNSPTTNISLQMVLAASLVYGLGRYRRFIKANY
jgi:hypothetical protein